jgi:hypothetical protein
MFEKGAIEVVEFSEDRERGAMPHIRSAIAQLSHFGMCTQCTHRRATHLIDTRSALRVVCDRCAAEWCAFTPAQRMAARQEFRTRGGR